MGIVSYLLGAAAAWGSVHAAGVIYMSTPLFLIVRPQWRPAGQAAGKQ